MQLGNMRLNPVKAPAAPAARSVTMLALHCIFGAAGIIGVCTGSRGVTITSDGDGVYHVDFPAVKRAFAAEIAYYDASGGVETNVVDVSLTTSVLTFTVAIEAAATHTATQAVEGDSIDVVLFVEHS